jgi:signal transduction histidine kinase
MIRSVSGDRYHTLTLAPIESIGVVATLHDVTAQHELDQAKNDLVSLVSHELRTPLTSIRGYGDMLHRYGLVEDKGRDFLQSILDESARLNALIQSFLDVASIESGRKRLDPTDFEIGTLVDEILETLAPAAASKTMALENRVDRGVRVTADRMLLFQAISNLVSNAIKYSPVDTSVRVDLSGTSEAIVFRVVDKGCGIPPDDARRVFEKFYRRSNEETRAESGFGLGLAFVRQVAEQHGGGVSVKSEVGSGSTFSLWLPVVHRGEMIR